MERDRLLKILPERANKPKKSHGKIGFESLADTVAANWRAADEATKAPCYELQRQDKIRQRKELKEYKETQRYLKRLQEYEHQHEQERIANDSGESEFEVEAEPIPFPVETESEVEATFPLTEPCVKAEYSSMMNNRRSDNNSNGNSNSNNNMLNYGSWEETQDDLFAPLSVFEFGVPTQVKNPSIQSPLFAPSS